MKELSFTIKGTIFVPEDAEYECEFEDQIYTFKIKDKVYSLIAGLEADENEFIVSDEVFKSHHIGLLYDEVYFNDTH